MVRREFLRTGCGALSIGAAVRRPGRIWREAREIVRSGRLGDVAFCRMVDGGVRAVDLVQFVFDGAMPVSVSELGGGRATFRYPGFVASYEREGSGGVWFCGSEGTLAVDGDGLRIFGAAKTLGRHNGHENT
jgi:hypothetical protein